MSSDDLTDEHSAINSIYGPDTLHPTSPSSSSTTSVLLIPNHSVSLRLHFPPTYPACSPPSIQGVETTGAHSKKGQGQHILHLARGILAEVYTRGEVCLFDLLEELQARLEKEKADDPAEEEQDVQKRTDDETSTREPTSTTDNRTLQPPPPTWTLSPPLTVKKSLFLARCASASSPAHAAASLAHLLATDKRAARASHNISAYRIRGNGSSGSAAGPRSAERGSRGEEAAAERGPREEEAATGSSPAAAAAAARRGTEITYEEYDDDGETAAGGRLLKLLQSMGVWGVVVVVTRWYGGVELGPGRFGVVCGVAREALVGWERERERERERGESGGGVKRREGGGPPGGGMREREGGGGAGLLNGEVGSSKREQLCMGMYEDGCWKWGE